MNFKYGCILVWAISWLGNTEYALAVHHQASATDLSSGLQKRSADTDEGEQSQNPSSGLVDFLKKLQRVGRILASKNDTNDSKTEGSGSSGIIDDLRDLMTEGSGSFGGGIQGLSDLLPEGSGDTDPFQGLLDLVFEGSGSAVLEGLGGLAEALEQLSLFFPSDDDGANDEEPDGKTPCSSPFIDIAYKMCVLPVLDQRLSWSDASEYCSSRGSQLATDSVVIKSRRYLNDELGELGSRVRWPIWVGAKRQDSEDGQQTWLWHDGTSVASFLWTDGQPRSYDINTIPDGACMILDGYQEYYAVSLPCHFKRRFLCRHL